jgi:hypothetical protein
VLAAAASTSQLVLRQFVDDFDKRQVGRQRLAFPRCLVGATTSSSASSATGSVTLSASLKRANCGFARSTVTPEETLKQQRIIFLEMNNLGPLHSP